MGEKMSDPFGSYWKMIEPPKQRSIDVILPTPENLGPLIEWLGNLGSPGASPILTLPGRDRLALVEQLKEDSEGLYGTTPVGKDLPTPFISRLIRHLMQAPELVVEGPLRGYADKSSHVAHDVYRLLWEGRFILREKPEEFETFVMGMVKWIGESSLCANVERIISGPQEQTAVLCFLTALAAQNDLVKRVVIFYDQIDLIEEDRNLARNFMAVISEVRRWAIFAGCPLGLLLGFAGSRSDIGRLRKLNPMLGAELEAGLSWTKK